MKNPYQINCREEGRGKPSVNKFATLPEAQTYIKDRWQGADYMDGDSGFHTDASTYELIGFTLKDVGTVSWLGEGAGIWRDYKFTDFTAEKKPEPIQPAPALHSLGPWHVEKNLTLWGADDTLIAGIYNTDTEQLEDTSEAKANARLIATAPEMLAGLEMAVLPLFQYVNAGCPGASASSRDGTEDTLALLRTIIAKAKGLAPAKAAPAKPVPMLPVDKSKKNLAR